VTESESPKLSGELDEVLAAHDELLARHNVEVWIGAEPTFTRADSFEPAWTNAAEGDDKLARAHALASHLAEGLPGAAMSRVIGRQYPDEPDPRFAFGVRWREGHVGKGERIAPSAAPEPPPTELGDDRWITVTPDPGVIEVNMAPCATARAFLHQTQQVWAAAAATGLSPVRRRFNGDLVDSGGGGQLTLGGAHPRSSPFVRHPHVLPALIRYVNNHPSLSYWFAGECLGSASQGPRPDEGVRERYDELAVTLGWLDHLADRGDLPPEQLWHTLGPLLVDASGNSHRAELNVEKLWNPHISTHGPRHGRMGLVELRAVRMPERPAMLAALATFLRSIVARLVVARYRAPLIDWQGELHDRFALPTALHHDLRTVFADLDEHGVGIPIALRRELEAWRPSPITCELGDARLELRPALEFWPLVGDVASQERAGSRLVDASTQRWELAIEGAGPDRVVIGGKWAHLRVLADHVRALGVRRRVYQPWAGLHPGLPATDPLVTEWSWSGRTQRVELWAWRPNGGPYDGVPGDDAEALARRNERVRITTREGELHADATWHETRPFSIDLRRDAT
jgi:uncharacterized protein (DUF2126 family)